MLIKSKQKYIPEKHQKFFQELADLFRKNNFCLKADAIFQPYFKTVSECGNNIVYYTNPEINEEGNLCVNEEVVISNLTKLSVQKTKKRLLKI